MSVDPVSLAITAALFAANMALTMTQTIEGARLKDLNATVADYGTVTNNIYGERWVNCPCFYCEPIKEVKKKRKTKGGKYNEYTYFGTWAIHVAHHQVSGISAVKFDEHLVYDTVSGDNIFELAEDYELSQSVRFYLGTEDQEPDPDMLAFVEAEYGAGTCPAYRGSAYMFFKDVPLERAGNRFPQVQARTFGAGQYEFTRVTFDEGEGIPWLKFSPSASLIFGAASEGLSPEDLTIWDNEARSLLVQNWDYATKTFSFAASTRTGIRPLAIADNGDLYGDDLGSEGIFCRLDGMGEGTITGLHDTDRLWFANVYNMPDTTERVVALNVFLDSAPSFKVWVWNVDTSTMTELDIETETGTLWAPRAMFQDTFGDIWVVGTAPNLGGNVSTAYFWRVVDTGSNPGISGFQTVVGLPSLIGVPATYTVPGVYAFYAQDDTFVFAWGAPNGSYRYLVKVDPDASTVTDTRDLGGNILIPGDDGDRASDPIAPGASSFWAHINITTGRTAYEIDALTLDTLQNLDLDLWWADEAGDPEVWYVYDRVGDALIAGWVDTDDGEGGSLSWRSLGTEVTLATIVRDVSAQVGLVDGTDFICPDLEAIPVVGYNWTQGSAKNVIAPLLDLYDCQARPHNDLIQFIRRGGAAGSLIETPDFVAGSGGGRYRLTVAGDTDLPRRAFLTFADISANHEPNTAKAQRNLTAVDGVGEVTIDMTTLALDATEAQQLADRHFRGIWFRRTTAELPLTMNEAAIEPGDVHFLSFDGVTMTMCCLKAVFTADGAINTEWEQDSPSLAALGDVEGAPASGIPPSVVPIATESVGFLLDVPLLTDADDQTAPFIYASIAPEDDDGMWFGGSFLNSDTGTDGSFAEWEAFVSTEDATWGTVATPPAAALPWIVDDGPVMTVVLENGELESITLDQMLNDGSLNLAAYGSAATGWEIMQFRVATLVAASTYEITGRIRGARGTEHLIGTQLAGAQFVLLDNTHVVDMGASEIGDTDYYKAMSAGRGEPATSEALEFEGNAHRPYAAVHGSLTLSGSDWLIDAMRRTRIGGSTVDGQDVPLGETSESWQADIYDGVTFKRTISGTSLPLTYTAADQTTDFGASVTSGFEVELYQMSPALSLRGFPLALAA